MSPLHVLVDERDRQDEVQVEHVHHVGDHTGADCQRRVLEICQLDVHRAELHPPADVSIFRWRVLEPQAVPIRRLQVLEVRVTVDGWALEEPGRADAFKMFIVAAAEERRIRGDLIAV